MRGSLAFLAVLLAVLVGCEKTSDLYGGGDGLTLAFDDGPAFVFEPARKKDLQDAAHGRPTTGPVGYVSVVGESWSARGDDDVGALSYLEAFGLDCPFQPGVTQMYVDGATAGVWIVLYDGEEVLRFRLNGEVTGGSGDAFAGEFDVTAESWVAPFDRCDGDATSLPTTYSISYSFDETPHVVNRCVGCDLF